MPDIKNNAVLPKAENNGLAAIASVLADEGTGRAPQRFRAVIGIVNCRRVTVDADTHDELATVRFLRVELLLPEDLEAAEKLLRRALEHRSGQDVLPLDLEDEITQAFRDALADPPAGTDDDNPDGKGKKGDKK